MTDQDWLRTFTEISAAIRAAVAPLSGTEAGRVEHGTGAGGDRTVEMDRLAETTALARLEALAAKGERFSLLSEEIGVRDFGAPYPLVLLDPIDGSLNAKQGLPLYAVMLSLLDGPNAGDTRVGHVLNAVSGERWDAIRGGGGFRDGQPLRPLKPAGGAGIEILGLESSPRNLRLVQPLIERAHKLRLLGSMALSIAHTASGGIDVHCSPIPARVFDMTASALLVAEVGGLVTDLQGRPLAGAGAGLDSRSTLLCSASPDLHRLAAGLLAKAPA